MKDATYAVSWRQENGSEGTGRLELGPDSLRLEGRNEGLPVGFELPYGAVKSFRLAHVNGERLRSRPTLVLELVGGETVRIASLAQPGIVSEVADRISTLRAERRPTRAAVVVPLKEGARDDVARLLAQGPPFDPAALGLERHEVFLGDRAAIFVFEGVPTDVLERLLADEAVAEASEAWETYLDGRLQYADQVYDWVG